MKKSLLFYVVKFFALSRIGCLLLVSFCAYVGNASSQSDAPIERFVDQRSPEYQEFLVVQEEINHLNAQIRALGRRDPLHLSVEKSVLEDTYCRLLQGRGQTYFFQDGRQPSFFYKGDDLWYYRAIRNSREVSFIENHSIQGPCVNRLNSDAPIRALRLKNPFIYLVSFNQIENICGFAALANAAALEVQATTGRPITFAETRKLAEDNICRILAPVMEDLPRGDEGRIEYAGQELLARGATRLNLDGIVEYFDKRAVQDLHERLRRGVHADRNAQFERIIAGNRNLHIIYNVGGCHWVNVSLIRDVEGRRHMFLLDSSNAPLEEENDVTILLRYCDDIIESVFLKQATDEPDLQRFNDAINHNTISLPRLLDRLVRSCIVSAPAASEEKKLVHAKIDAVSKLVKIGDLPKTMQVFLTEQASKREHLWPKSFQDLVASGKPGTPKKKPSPEIKEKSDNAKLFFGLLLGASTFAFILWLKQRAPHKKKQTQDLALIRSQDISASDVRQINPN